MTATVKEIFTVATTIVETFMTLHHQTVHVALVSTAAIHNSAQLLTSRAEARPVPCPIYFKLVVPYYPHSHIIIIITTDKQDVFVIKIHLIKVPSKTKISFS